MMNKRWILIIIGIVLLFSAVCVIFLKHQKNSSETDLTPEAPISFEYEADTQIQKNDEEWEIPVFPEEIEEAEIMREEFSSNETETQIPTISPSVENSERSYQTPSTESPDISSTTPSVSSPVEENPPSIPEP